MSKNASHTRADFGGGNGASKGLESEITAIRFVPRQTIRFDLLEVGKGNSWGSRRESGTKVAAATRLSGTEWLGRDLRHLDFVKQ